MPDAGSPSLAPSHQFPIESGVPIPHAGRGRRRYPIKALKIGDSFFVPADERGAAYVASRLSHVAWTAKMRTGAQFTVRQFSDGARLWRIG